MSDPPVLSAPALKLGGTYALLVETGAAAEGLSTNSSAGCKEFLIGHLAVQWSPFFPQVLHTMRTASGSLGRCGSFVEPVNKCKI